LTLTVNVSEVLSAQMNEFPQIIVHMKSPSEIFALLSHQLLHFRFANRQLLHGRQSGIRRANSGVVGNLMDQSMAKLSMRTRPNCHATFWKDEGCNRLESEVRDAHVLLVLAGVAEGGRVQPPLEGGVATTIGPLRAVGVARGNNESRSGRAHREGARASSPQSEPYMGRSR
jgi:hypothetical protein